MKEIFKRKGLKTQIQIKRVLLKVGPLKAPTLNTHIPASRLAPAAGKENAAELTLIPTGRVVVSTGRYVVPASKVIIIVSPGRLSLVPTVRVLSPGRVK
ncbi:hypothetical protein Tco_0178821 [Tanacetum coccineum]